MSYEFYRVVHLCGILFLFTSLGGHAMLAARGGPDDEIRPLRKGLMIAHGVALLIIFVAGFGLMARLGIFGGTGWPTWIYVKIALWLLFGVSVTVIRRQPALARSWVLILPLIGTLTAYVAIYKLR